MGVGTHSFQTLLPFPFPFPRSLFSSRIYIVPTVFRVVSTPSLHSVSSSLPLPMSSSASHPHTATITPDGVPIHSLQFNKQGVRSLRTFLGDGWVYEQFMRNFKCADFAWFAAVPALQVPPILL